MQFLKIHACEISQFHMFEVVPEALVQRTQVGSVPWHCLYVDAPRSFANQEFPNFAPTMDWRAIPDDEQPFSRLRQQVLEEDDAVETRQRFLPNQRVNLPSQRETGHDRKMVSTRPVVNDRRLSFRSVGSDNARQQIDAGFIGKNQGSALPRRSSPQLRPNFHTPVCD